MKVLRKDLAEFYRFALALDQSADLRHGVIAGYVVIADSITRLWREKFWIGDQSTRCGFGAPPGHPRWAMP